MLDLVTVTAPRSTYARRFGAVLAYVDAHPGGDLALETLSGIAAYSKFHFHRQFGALMGMSVHRYVLYSRMKRASFLLAFRPQQVIGEIAAACGYEPEAFARAFRQLLGTSPSAFRAAPDWVDWNARFEPYLKLRRVQMSIEPVERNVAIVAFPATSVGLLEHRGDPRRLNDSIRRFIDWRRRNALPPRASATFNILYDDPEQTPAAEFRFGLCAATTKDIEPNEEGVVAAVIPGGPCARLRHIGPDERLEQSVRWLYSNWLPASGQEPRDFPPFLQRVQFYPEVAEQEAVTDIYLPLRS